VTCEINDGLAVGNRGRRYECGVGWVVKQEGDLSDFPCSTGECIPENCCEQVRCSNHNKAGDRD